MTCRLLVLVLASAAIVVTQPSMPGFVVTPHAWAGTGTGGSGGTSIPTSTSTTTISTTSTSVMSTTTSTTVPAASCDGFPDAPTFESLLCRTPALLDRVNGESRLEDTFQAKLARKVERASERLEEALRRCSEGNRGRTRKHLQVVAKLLGKYVKILDSPRASTKIDAPDPEVLRLEFLTAGEAIRADTILLRAEVGDRSGSGACVVTPE